MNIDISVCKSTGPRSNPTSKFTIGGNFGVDVYKYFIKSGLGRVQYQRSSIFSGLRSRLSMAIVCCK